MKSVNGPFLLQGSGGSTWVTTVPSFTTVTEKTTAFRPRPLSLLGAFTPHRRYEYTIRNGMLNNLSSFGPADIQTGSPPMGFENEAYQSARRSLNTEMLGKIKGEEWNVSTFLGELPETISYFRDTLATVLRTFRSVRRGDMREVRRMARKVNMNLTPPVSPNRQLATVTGKWLEWRYAISPLMSDLDSSIKALYSSSSNFAVRRFSVKQQVKSKQQSQRSINPRIFFLEKRQGNLRLGVIVKINPDVQQYKRLGLLNPVATLWELLPLSFVVDWLIPIGEYLGSLDAMVGVSVLSGWESERGSTELQITTGTYSRYDSTGALVSRTSYSGSMSNGNWYTRRAYTPSLPSLSFEPSLNAKRLLDACALARTFLVR